MMIATADKYGWSDSTYEELTPVALAASTTTGFISSDITYEELTQFQCNQSTPPLYSRTLPMRN